MSEEAQALIEAGLNRAEPEMKLGDWLFSLVPDEARGDDLIFEIDDLPKPAEFK